MRTMQRLRCCLTQTERAMLCTAGSTPAAHGCRQSSRTDRPTDRRGTAVCAVDRSQPNAEGANPSKAAAAKPLCARRYIPVKPRPAPVYKEAGLPVKMNPAALLREVPRLAIVSHVTQHARLASGGPFQSPAQPRPATHCCSCGTALGASEGSIHPSIQSFVHSAVTRPSLHAR